MSRLVKEQEDNEDDDDGIQTTNQLLSIEATPRNQMTKNKITEKWKRKVANRSGILDMGCTLGAGAERTWIAFMTPASRLGKYSCYRTKKNKGHKENVTQAQSLGQG
jgi:hypothetical protein